MIRLIARGALVALIAVVATGGPVPAAFGTGEAGAVAPAPPTKAEARKIFYDLLKERSEAVEKSVYARIEPLYWHDGQLLVLRHEVVLRGWKAVEAYWKHSMSRPPRKEPFKVTWNDDLVVVVQGGLIVGGLTWSNQLGQNPPHYGCLSLALRRQGDKWVIVHEHSSNWTKPAAATD